jgi:hypothetical protein
LSKLNQVVTDQPNMNQTFNVSGFEGGPGHFPEGIPVMTEQTHSQQNISE